MEPQHWKDTIPPFHRWCHGFPRCTVWGGKERGISQAEIEDLPRSETPLCSDPFSSCTWNFGKVPESWGAWPVRIGLVWLAIWSMAGEFKNRRTYLWDISSPQICEGDIHPIWPQSSSSWDNRHSWRYVSCWWKCNSVFGCWGSFPTWSPAHQESLPAWWGVVMGGGSLTSLYHFCVPKKTAFWTEPKSLMQLIWEFWRIDVMTHIHQIVIDSDRQPNLKGAPSQFFDASW